MATYSSTLAWKIPGTEKPGRVSRKESDTTEQLHFLSFLVAQLVKNEPAMQRPGFDPWDGKMPRKRDRSP